MDPFLIPARSYLRDLPKEKTMKTPLNVLSLTMMAVLVIAALSVRAEEGAPSWTDRPTLMRPF